MAKEEARKTPLALRFSKSSVPPPRQPQPHLSIFLSLCLVLPGPTFGIFFVLQKLMWGCKVQRFFKMFYSSPYFNFCFSPRARNEISKPRSESQPQDESSCKLHQPHPSAPALGSCWDSQKASALCRGPGAVTFQRLPLRAPEATENMFSCEWGHREMERRNQLMDTAPRAGSSFRAAFGKQSGGEIQVWKVSEEQGGFGSTSAPEENRIGDDTEQTWSFFEENRRDELWDSSESCTEEQGPGRVQWGKGGVWMLRAHLSPCQEPRNSEQSSSRGFEQWEALGAAGAWSWQGWDSRASNRGRKLQLLLPCHLWEVFLFSQSPAKPPLCTGRGSHAEGEGRGQLICRSSCKRLKGFLTKLYHLLRADPKIQNLLLAILHPWLCWAGTGELWGCQALLPSRTFFWCRPKDKRALPSLKREADWRDGWRGRWCWKLPVPTASPNYSKVIESRLQTGMADLILPFFRTSKCPCHSKAPSTAIDLSYARWAFRAIGAPCQILGTLRTKP